MTARDQLADVIEDAIDSVHDMDVTHRDYANAADDAVLGMIKAAVLAEREACAMVLDYMRDDNDDALFLTACDEAADAIRARPPIPS